MNCDECNNKRANKSCFKYKHGPCMAGSTEKLTVFDWLADLPAAGGAEPFDCVEIRFKNGRKAFYRNASNLPLQVGDIVAVESSPGHDIGTVSLVGDLMRMQMSRKKTDPADPEIKKVYRKANQKDIDIWKLAIARERDTLVGTRELNSRLGLEMKLCDVEFQGDNTKATFFYTAEGRVDFRQLIKDIASRFGIRVEMRQIGLRQEAARVGGISSCGREMCCTTWMTDFRSVNTSAARYQRLSLNPQKLAGQCGKLKCCLNYELDVYVDAMKGFPDSDVPLRTEKGNAYYQKMDIFRRMYWYAYEKEVMNWIPIPVDAVREIQKINAQGRKVESLEEYSEESKPAPKADRIPELKTVEGGDVTRFDKQSSARRNRRNRGANNRPTGNEKNVPENGKVSDVNRGAVSNRESDRQRSNEKGAPGNNNKRTNNNGNKGNGNNRGGNRDNNNKQHQ